MSDLPATLSFQPRSSMAGLTTFISGPGEGGGLGVPRRFPVSALSPRLSAEECVMAQQDQCGAVLAVGPQR